MTIALGELIGVRFNPIGVFLGSLLPDLDFVLLVPFLGRRRGHRTAMHSPVCSVISALFLRRFGMGSVLLGALAHSLIDDFVPGDPPGVAWFWPFSGARFRISQTSTVDFKLLSHLVG